MLELVYPETGSDQGGAHWRGQPKFRTNLFLKGFFFKGDFASCKKK
jgi:hypothetical protein